MSVMTRIWTWVRSCWHGRKQIADLYSCRFCRIPFSMTKEQWRAHQREVHPFTRDGVPVR